MLQKIYWNRHKYNSNSLELNSFGSIIHYCFFYNEESSIFLENNKNKYYFSPILQKYKLIFILKDKIREYEVDVYLLVTNEHDLSILLISYFKDILIKEDMDHLLSFIEKIKFWKKSKSRFFKDITLVDYTMTINFSKLSTRIENIIFS